MFHSETRKSKENLLMKHAIVTSKAKYKQQLAFESVLDVFYILYVIFKPAYCNMIVLSNKGFSSYSPHSWKSQCPFIWIQRGIQYTNEQNNSRCVQNWSEIKKKGSSTVWSGSKYSLALVLFLRYSTLHHIFFPFLMTLPWHMWNSFYLERGSEVTFPLFWMPCNQLERQNNGRIRTDLSFPACRDTVVGCHSHVCSLDKSILKVFM